jgi:hypothetical protein
MEDIIQSGLDLSDDDCVGIDAISLRFEDSRPESSAVVAAGSSLDTDLRLDIELGDVGLRHRSADSMAESKKG